jgi:colanic acid biosynthesis glycosyl transferase WcaI
MRYTIVSSVFPPETTVSSRTSYDLAEALARAGHDVTVITAFPNRPEGRLYPGYRRRFTTRERSEAGFEIIRCFSVFSRRSSILSRLMENVTFGITSLIALLRQPKCDAIYSNTWPIIATGLLAMFVRVRKIPMLISVQDMYPESLIVQGRLGKQSLLAKLLVRFDGAIARSARSVAVITPAMAGPYADSRRLDPSGVLVVRNWMSEEWMGEAIDPGTFRKVVGIPPQAFVFGYGGNIGVAASVETLIEAFRWLGDLPDVHLLIGGGGSSLEQCQRLAEAVAPDRIHFRSPWPVGETAALLFAADVLVLPTLGAQSMASVPSKLISYMLSGKPTVALALDGSDTQAVMDEAEAGWVLSPGDPQALAKILRMIARLPADELARRGASARAYAEANLTRAAGLPMLLSAFEAIAN